MSLWEYEDLLFWHLWCYELYEADYTNYYRLIFGNSSYYPGS